MGQKIFKSSDLFENLFLAQKAFNLIIRSENPLGDNSEVEWSKQLILGLISESSELLEQIDWKAHSNKVSRGDLRNIHMEIVDLFKYVLSLAELWEMTSDQLIAMSYDKSIEVLLKWEMQNWKPDKPNILITDMDGTLADWRKTFLKLATDEEIEDSSKSLAIETELQITYDEYVNLKWKLESEGLYAQLEPIRESIEWIKSMEKDWEIVVFTARPVSKLKRIWYDSFAWLKMQEITPNLLRIGHEERILYAIEMIKKGYNVIMFEDNPELAYRAANSGIGVVLIPRPYNSHLNHKNIEWFEY